MKLIPLTQGYFAQVDDADYDVVSQFKWHAQKGDKDRTVYARRNVTRPNGTRTAVLLHRFIFGLTDPVVHVDHEDHNGLNCQRYNMRLATRRQNMGNQNLSTNNTSRFKGVHWKKDRKWGAQTRLQSGELHHIGYFNNPIAAALAYDAAAIELYGEFARTNASLGLLPAVQSIAA